jgi:hypothetical protein
VSSGSYVSFYVRVNEGATQKKSPEIKNKGPVFRATAGVTPRILHG